MKYNNGLVPCHLCKCPRGGLFLIPEDKVVRFEEVCGLVGPSWVNDDAYFTAMEPYIDYEVDRSDLRVYSWSQGPESS